MNRPSNLKFSRKDFVVGIYKIENRLSGKFYIGSSSNLYRRYSDHLRELERNTHSNPKLQASWNKYGRDNFEFSIIEECSLFELQNREQYYIDTLAPYFNIAMEVGFPATPKAGTVEAKERSKKNLESRKNSPWCNSLDFHSMISSLMVGRWKDPAYKESRSIETRDLWNNSDYREKQKHAHRKIDEIGRVRIREMKEQGHRICDIALAYQVSTHTIARIIKGLH